MLIIKTNNDICPNCKATKDLKPRGKTDVVCMTCGHYWNPTTDGMQGTKVRIIEPFSVWLGMLGHIMQILPTTGRNIRVSFKPSKTDTFADLFHCSHLEELP